jgi:hypothetical protein
MVRMVRSVGATPADPVSPDSAKGRLGGSGHSSADRPPLLPTDLPGALSWLSDAELMALASSVAVEQKRRQTAKAAQSASGVGAGRPRIKSSPKRKSRPAADTAPPLPKARVNAIRAAFKAGIKPSVIARQFGVSQDAIRQALAEG